METAQHESSSISNSLLTLSLVPGIGPITMTSLLDFFDSPDDVLAQDVSSLQRVAGVGPKLAREIVLANKTINTRAILEHCRVHDIQIVDRFNWRYPRPLLEIHNPPSVLYFQGSLRDSDVLAIAIVGSRHASAYGKRTAEKLARGLASAGYTIVSGLARGIDQAAHRGALAAGGRTIGVLASGVLNIYPPEHEELAKQISNSGALMSEVPPHHPPKSGAFPQRNRIVSGLCLGTIVVEAAQRSGALISARLAMEQGRDVFAVPGPVDSRVSQGCHQLIRDGAILVESTDDVLREMGPLPKPVVKSDGGQILHPAELQLNDQESSILNAIDVTPTDIETIAETTEIAMPNVLATISVLEIRRLIRRISGNQVARLS